MIKNAMNQVFKLRRSVPNELCHYCKADSIKYLVNRNADIWCTKYDALNDNQECTFGINLFIKYLIDNKIIPIMSANLIRKKIFERDIFNKPVHSAITPFLFSLSEKKDDKYFWDNYVGQEGGFCVVFDGIALEDASIQANRFLNKMNVGNVGTLYLLPCFYKGLDDEDIEKIFQGLLIDFRHELEVLRHPVSAESAMDAIRPIDSGLRIISEIIKSEKWSNEKEWRLILNRERYISDLWPNNRSRTYISLMVGELKELFKDVLVYPKEDQNKVKNKLMLEINN